MKSFFSLIKNALFAFCLFSGFCTSSWAVDNRLCPVKSAADDGSAFTLRRDIEQGFNRTTNRACTEVIRFDAGQTFNIVLHDTLQVTNANDTDTDHILEEADTFENDNYNLLVDGHGATVTIDAINITSQGKCAIELLNNNSKWQYMILRVSDASKAFCDTGNGNHHTSGEDGLIIQVVDQNGNNQNPPGPVCENSNPCCNNGQWKAPGSACTAPNVTDGHCNASNQCEGSTPAPPDADNDDIPDASDNCPAISNHDQADGDHDGVGDACDNCPQNANPTQEDSNHNGVGNACDAGNPPVNTDTDGDAILDASDNCPSTSNADQADLDHDGTGDACDNDVDGDGIPNNQDSYPSDADHDQDGVIDGVDNCPTQAGPGSNHGCPASTGNPVDSDGDGVANDQDQCPAQAGPSSHQGCPLTIDSSDSDHDGVPNESDACPAQAGLSSNHGCPILDTNPSESSSCNDAGKSLSKRNCVQAGCSLERGAARMNPLSFSVFILLGILGIGRSMARKVRNE